MFFRILCSEMWTQKTIRIVLGIELQWSLSEVCELILTDWGPMWVLSFSKWRQCATVVTFVKYALLFATFQYVISKKRKKWRFLKSEKNIKIRILEHWTTSRSVQPFLHGSRQWPTHRHTHERLDLCSNSQNYMYTASQVHHKCC